MGQELQVGSSRDRGTVVLCPSYTAGLREDGNHEPSLASQFHEIRVFHDLQVVRDGHDFRFEKFCNIADREFAVSQRIDDSQTMGITQPLRRSAQKFASKTSCARELTVTRKSEDHETVGMMLIATSRAGNCPGDQTALFGRANRRRQKSCAASTERRGLRNHCKRSSRPAFSALPAN